MRMGRDALPGNSPGNSDADAESAADVSRMHSVYDGSSGLQHFALLPVGPRLL
jgi:hypothetical protein